MTEDDDLPVRLGHLTADSLAPAVHALVSYSAMRRPAVGRSIRATVVLRFAERYPGVRVTFSGTEIEVGDETDTDGAPDLTISGRLGDVNALLASPLTGGLPRPTHARGRAALARLADGRVEFKGPIGLARKVLRFLTIEDAMASRRELRRRGQDASGPALPP